MFKTWVKQTAMQGLATQKYLLKLKVNSNQVGGCLCLGSRSVVRQITENLLFSLAVVISKISQHLARSQWLCFTDSQCRTIDMLNADKAYISVPVTSLRTSNQCVPYVSSPMPSKVEAALLKNELQKAQVSCNKLPTHKIPYTHYSTQ